MSVVEDRLVLGPELAGTLMTPEEFDAVEDCDELFVYELIHGVLVVNPPPSEGERGPNELLGRLLFAYQEQNPQGSAMNYSLNEHAVRSDDSRRRADRVIWAGLGRMPHVRRDVPAIVVEFVSAGKRNRIRDYQAKRDEYRAAGIIEYWVIDRFRRQMTVFFKDGSQVMVAEADSYRTPLLPGFELPLSRLFAEADLLEKNS